eukprot:TRINITY_DN1633_c0_g1_i2.p1 TRINITY_DN1633_c0_g1~~TRINITY_DN1633_c0_g1_i2.p1  ORF type:complete len:109 (+),score=18.06 TRINITY_DN1633_c0_g1_i2:35-361(+)
MATMSQVFIAAKRGKQTVFLEPNISDKIQTAVDIIADLVQKDGDDIALVYKDVVLDSNKTFGDCKVSHEGESIVEPIFLHFVYKEGDDWEKPVLIEEPAAPAAEEGAE